MKVSMTWIVLAAWACWMAVVEPPYCICSPLLIPEALLNDHKLSDPPPYTVTFSTKGATHESYSAFLRDLRYRLAEYANKSLEIPVLPPPKADDNKKQYVYVELSNGNYSITLALNVSTVDVVGYQAGETSYFFNGTSKRTRIILFPSTKQYVFLPLTPDYEALEAAAGASRGRKGIDLGIELGIGALHQHIETLYFAGNSTADISKALIVMTQMIPEAARIRYIQRQVLRSIAFGGTEYQAFYPDKLMLDYENKWRRLSSAVQSAVYGVFPMRMRLVMDTNNWLLDSVRQVLFDLALMPVVCGDNKASKLQYIAYRHSSSIPIRSILEADPTDEICETALDPVVHIAGYNGLCVDVKGGDYTDGNKIVLSECSKEEVSQLWTLSTKDQTIQSNGKCLTVYAYVPNKTIMIYNCSKTTTDSIKWDVWSNGSITNPKSGLHLAAKKDDKGNYNVVLDYNFNGPRQGWYASNITEPPLKNIFNGYNSNCLMALNANVMRLLPSCSGDKAREIWAIYPDGTIRPMTYKGSCIKVRGDNVDLGDCVGGADESWRYQSDGTFLHEQTQKVMDIGSSDDMGLKLTLNDNNPESLSQLWLTGPMQ